MSFWQEEDFWLRALCLLACIPSGGALLAKVFGLASMEAVTLFLFVPGALFLVAAWWWATRSDRSYLADALAIGFWGGLLGTVAYDLSRVPFLVLLGQRVFAPINVYGVWLADAAHSTRFTDLLGWSYHFSNGITFGIMYALFMRRQHWLWAIVWAFLLETIAILSPFSTIFNLSGNYGAIGIAYLGHLAYGLPLGWLVYRWRDTKRFLAMLPLTVRRGWLIMALLLLLIGAWRPSWRARDARAAPETFLVEGQRLNPGWLRIARGEEVTVSNPQDTNVSLVNKTEDQTIPLEAATEIMLEFGREGIYQFFVATEGRTHSSFVIVEPVEEMAR